MKAIRRNTNTFFPQAELLAVAIQFLHYFQPKRSTAIYQLTGKDFATKEITAVNIEDPNDVQLIPFRTPVTPLKKF